MTLARPPRLLLGAAAVATVLAAAACSSSAGTPSSNTSVTTHSKPEKTHIKVATLPIADAADLFIAINKGYFRKQGLTVTPEIIQATPQITPDLVAGKVDFSLLNYVSTMEIEQNGGVRFKYVAPGTVAAANVSELLVPKGSPIKTLADLKGKTTAQSSTSNWAGVARDAGANVEAVEGFVQAIQLLKDKRVDATVNDTLAVGDYQRAKNDSSIKIAGKTGDTSDQAFASLKGSGLNADLNKALDELRADGTLKTISEKYFGSDVSSAA